MLSLNFYRCISNLECRKNKYETLINTEIESLKHVNYVHLAKTSFYSLNGQHINHLHV